MVDTTVKIGKWIVRIVRQGDKYGATMSLTHDDPEPMIEFYDSTHPTFHVMGGQFVARYYINTLFPDTEKRSWGDRGGLSLMGHEPAWTVDADTMRNIAWYINEFLED